jgi:hypothetical protein
MLRPLLIYVGCAGERGTMLNSHGKTKLKEASCFPSSHPQSLLEEHKKANAYDAVVQRVERNRKWFPPPEAYNKLDQHRCVCS